MHELGVVFHIADTLAKIADALGVKTKRLYEEVEGQEENEVKPS